MFYLLDPDRQDAPFPSVGLAETEPNGLLAMGGDLSPTRLLNAYRAGIFPWYSGDQPILWWSPSPRMVLYPERIKVSRSLKKTLRNKGYATTLDRAFAQVVAACAAPRKDTSETWITNEMGTAYTELHRLGYAHSVEVWDGSALIGGLYGVAIGAVFFGESMFSSVRDGSKVALVHLARVLESWDFRLIDCQVHTPHLLSLGAEDIPRERFVELLDLHCTQAGRPGLWSHCDPRP